MLMMKMLVRAFIATLHCYLCVAQQAKQAAVTPTTRTSMCEVAQITSSLHTAHKCFGSGLVWVLPGKDACLILLGHYIQCNAVLGE